MHENEPSRQSVKIPLDLVAEASPYMKRKGYKFQTLLLELFEEWLERQKKGISEAPAKLQPIRSKGQADHDLLDLALSGTDDEGKTAIRAMLAVVAKASKPKKALT